MLVRSQAGSRLVSRAGLRCFLALLTGAWAACAPSARPPEVSDRAPDFRLSDTSGRVVSLDDYKGRVVLLDFWATWCVTCETEMPVFETLYRRHRAQGFVVLAASIDEGGRKDVLPYLAQRPTLSFPVLLADSRTAAVYGVRGLPSGFLIGPGGRVARKYVGPVDPQTLENDILAVMKYSKEKS